jgi:hypothetical protein
MMMMMMITVTTEMIILGDITRPRLTENIPCIMEQNKDDDDDDDDNNNNRTLCKTALA